jgi:L-iditol 2-dehydrogenase
MKIAIYYGPYDIRIEDRPRFECPSEGVVCRVGAVGLCDIMDLTAWIGWPPEPREAGWARGHEWSAEIVEVGEKVLGYEVGDKVFGCPVFHPCHKCNACRVGDYWRCINWRDGMTQKALHGGMAEYLVMPFINNESAAKLPKELSWQDLALVEPVYLGIGLAAKVKPGQCAAIVGLDMMSFAGIQQMKTVSKAGKIICCDVSNYRLQKAKEMGADVCINSVEQDFVAAVMRETSGWGADVTILADNRPYAFMQAFQATRRQGNMWLGTWMYTPWTTKTAAGGNQWIGPGVAYPEIPITFDPTMLNIFTLWGTLGPRAPRWVQAGELIKSGAVNAEKFVTSTFPLEGVKDAFRTLEKDQNQIKVMIELQK